MVRLLVKGDRMDDSFHYMCGIDAPISMITRDVASIYSLRLACLKVSEFTCLSERDDMPTDIVSKGDSGNSPDNAQAFIHKSYPGLEEKTQVCGLLNCCSEGDACAAIKNASETLDRILIGLSRSANGPDRITGDVSVPVVTHKDLSSEFEINDPCLWCCGKLLCVAEGRELLRDFVSVNDRTNLTVHLRSAKDGPPPRANPIDQATYQNLVAFYHKRETDLKQMRKEAEESRDRDHFLNAEWANPRQLKNSLIGNGGRINYSF